MTNDTTGALSVIGIDASEEEKEHALALCKAIRDEAGNEPIEDEHSIHVDACHKKAKLLQKICEVK